MAHPAATITMHIITIMTTAATNAITTMNTAAAITIITTTITRRLS